MTSETPDQTATDQQVTLDQSSHTPLSLFSSIRARLAWLVGVSVLVAAIIGTIGTDAGVPLWVALPVTIALALAVTWWLATGLTAPIRQMIRATDQMARGDYRVQITSTSRDEVGQLARAFTQMAHELDQSDLRRRQLVATVAHELRTPLAAQQALLENLVDQVAAVPEQTLRDALAQSERLTALVADLLDLARTDGRSAPFNPNQVEVRQLLQSAVSEANLQGSDATITISTPPGLIVEADPARLSQAVANLLDNALRHSPSGGQVHLSAAVDDDVHWSLTVTDEGPGLAADRAERLFTSFGSNGASSGGGTGLGLAIAGWVTQMHSGAISVEHGGPGAQIRMLMPISQPVRAADSPGQSVPTPPQSPGDLTAREHLEPTPSRTSWLARYWPERVQQGQPRLLGAALIVGLAAAMLLPGNPVGLGLLVVLLLGGAALWLASPRRTMAWSWVSVAVSLPLVASTVLRADPIYSILAVLTAGVVAAVALTGAQTLREMRASVLSWPLAAIRGLPLLDRTLRATSRRSWAIARTALVSLLLLIIFGGLLASSDAVLGSWVAALAPKVSDVTIVRPFMLIFFAGLTLTGLYLAINPPAVQRWQLSQATSARVSPREWQIPLVVVITVFVAWLIAQGAALRGGHEFVQRTTGLTYAQSARSGFAQLLVVTALTLFLVSLVRAWGRAESAGERRTRQVLLLALCGLALLVVASALHRVWLYQEAFGWTQGRLAAALIESWLGVVLLITVGSLLLDAPNREVESRPGSWRAWGGRAALLAGVACTLVWSLGNTSAWITERNLDRFARTGSLDASYLAGLSEDAAPTISESNLPTTLKACILLERERPDHWSLSGWNLARSEAARIRAGYTQPKHCQMQWGDSIDPAYP